MCQREKASAVQGQRPLNQKKMHTDRERRKWTGRIEAVTRVTGERKPEGEISSPWTRNYKWRETELKAVCMVPLVWGCSQLVSERPAGPAWALTDADGFGKCIWGVEYSAPFIHSHHQQLLVFLQACDEYTWKIFELIHQLGPHFQICFLTRSVCQGADNTTIVGKYSLGMLQLRIISL